MNILRFCYSTTFLQRTSLMMTLLHGDAALNGRGDTVGTVNLAYQHQICDEGITTSAASVNDNQEWQLYK